MDFVCAWTRARGAALPVLTVFFITQSIFGQFQLFLGLDISEGPNEENEYRHSVVGLTVWSGRSFLCFVNFSLFNFSSPHVSAVEAGQVTCCVIGDNWLVNY
jgi:hypothetical protein